MENNKYITVSALNRYLQYKFENDNHLKTVFIKAEISNIRLSRGNLYFVLKDEDSEISALMFANMVRNLPFKPEDGMTVNVTGKISVYIKRGTYSITVNTIEEAGLGEAYLHFLQLKEKLAKEGLFDAQHKLPLPKMSENIGVITSESGDALQDIVSTISKRFPLAKIYLYPAQVQGFDAPRSLIKALKKAITDKLVDVIIISRGGGSVEDLSCFNDEGLAREIFKSKIPIVSAVGHENDYTIADFVASFRAPTPTGAAVQITKDQSDIITNLINQKRQITQLYKQSLIQSFNRYQQIIDQYGFKNFSKLIEKKQENLQMIYNHLQLVSPTRIIEKHQTKVEDLSLRLSLIRIDKKIDDFIAHINKADKSLIESINRGLDKYTDNINQKIDKMIILNPLNLMKKGYTISYQNQQVITSIKDLNKNQELTVRFMDGQVRNKIIEVKE